MALELRVGQLTEDEVKDKAGLYHYFGSTLGEYRVISLIQKTCDFAAKYFTDARLVRQFAEKASLFGGGVACVGVPTTYVDVCDAKEAWGDWWNGRKVSPRIGREVFNKVLNAIIMGGYVLSLVFPTVATAMKGPELIYNAVYLDLAAEEAYESYSSEGNREAMSERCTYNLLKVAKGICALAPVVLCLVAAYIGVLSATALAAISLAGTSFGMAADLYGNARQWKVSYASTEAVVQEGAIQEVG